MLCDSTVAVTYFVTSAKRVYNFSGKPVFLAQA